MKPSTVQATKSVSVRMGSGGGCLMIPRVGMRRESTAQRRESRRKVLYVFLLVDSCIAAGAIYNFFYLSH